jgi:hypothetical protein
MQSEAADTRARTHAAVFAVLVSQGYVHHGDIVRELNVRGERTVSGDSWTPQRVRPVLQRLVALGLVTLPVTGPYGSRRHRGAVP